MFEASMIYLYVVFGNVVGASVGLSVGLFGIYFVIMFVGLLHYQSAEVKEKKIPMGTYISGLLTKARFPAAVKFVIFAIVVNTLYPTTDNIKYIIGGAVAWNAAEWATNSEEAKRIPTSVLNAMNEFLENSDTLEKVVEGVAKTTDAVVNAAEQLAPAVKEAVNEVASEVVPAAKTAVNGVAQNVVEATEVQ